jgi:phosphatidate cytidylyltransferase
MSPRAALESDVFRAYVLIVVAMLVGAGGVLGVIRLARRRPVGHAAVAYRGWLIIAPVVLGCVFLGRETTIVFLTMLAVQGLRELVRASDLAAARGPAILASLGVVAGGVLCLLADPGRGPAGAAAFMALPVYVVPLLFLAPMVGDREAGQLRIVGLALLAFLLLGFMFGHVALLANARHPYGDLLFLLLAVELTDVAAYVSGHLVGRHALRPGISPGKTWEGAAGGLLTAMALPWLLRFSLPGLGARELVLAGLSVGVGGQLGDLSMSLIKRELGVKDMGALIPGHGGVLDRIDSLIFAAPLFFHLVASRHGP